MSWDEEEVALLRVKRIKLLANYEATIKLSANCKVVHFFMNGCLDVKWPHESVQTSPT